MWRAHWHDLLVEPPAPEHHCADAPPRRLALASAGRRLPVSFTDLVVTPGNRAEIDYRALRRERRRLQELVGTPQEASTWRELKRKGENWLQFLDEAKSLKSTDILSSDWVAWDSDHCSPNLSPEGSAFWHPQFQFKDEVKAVSIKLTKQGEKEPFYDVIFAGRPGGPKIVPNHATPAGGDKPLFPEFCPSISKDQIYILHLEHLLKGTERASLPLFEEDIRLKPVVDVHDITPRAVERLQELDRILGPEPRPIYYGPKHDLDSDTNGAAIPERPGDPEEIDPETGLPPMPLAEKKVFFANKRSDDEAQDAAQSRRNWLTSRSTPQVIQAGLTAAPPLLLCGQLYRHEAARRQRRSPAFL
eukprot:TRINITY_DN31138_c0_g1_i1.p1 TRINITY_DN31138_c0_g1~~TRINITY_DN31138_c0_g1_i1.p1  ORF type:complete len:360 (-),score=65.47 TRINITY_DN31138_c0_g1_i1:91-1170(-)